MRGSRLKNRARRHSRSRLRSLWLISTAILGLFLLFIFSLTRSSDLASSRTEVLVGDSSYPTTDSGESAVETLGPSPPHRPVYPHSVIPGGIRDLAELRSAILADAVVSAHYLTFDLTKARIVHVDSPKLVYVSYRLGNHLFWTKKKLQLHQGEPLITDGVNYARARCGNMISELPQIKTSPMEPTSVDFDTPLQPPDLPKKANRPDNRGGGLVVWIPPVIGGHEKSIFPTPTPEPGTMLLFSSGLGSYLIYAYRTRFKK